MDIKLVVKNSQDKIEPTVKGIVGVIDREHFWERVTAAFRTREVQKIAGELGLSYQSVYKWQKGKFPSRETLDKISALTGSSIEWLLTGRGSQHFEKVTLTGHPDDHIEDYILYGIDDVELRDSILAVLEEPDETRGGDTRVLMQEWVREGFTKWLARRRVDSPDKARDDSFQILLGQMVQKEVNHTLRKLIIDARTWLQHKGRTGRLTTKHHDIARVFEERIPEYSDTRPEDFAQLQNYLPDDFTLPEGIGLLFKDWDKLTEEDKAKTLTQIKELATDLPANKTPNGKKKK